MEPYKNSVDEKNVVVDPIILNPINTQDEYSLSPSYKIIHNSLAYPFDKSSDLLFLEKLKVDLNIWFESKNLSSHGFLSRMNSSLGWIKFRKWR